jgi:hypothetical protein
VAIPVPYEPGRSSEGREFQPETCQPGGDVREEQVVLISAKAERKRDEVVSKVHFYRITPRSQRIHRELNN